MANRKRQTREARPPLKPFDFNLVRARLDGLLFNVNRGLEKRLNVARSHADKVSAHELLLMMAFIRLAANSYNALRYLVAEEPQDANRKPHFVLVIPPVNRQLLDLLFTLVYMFDDFRPRSRAYRRATWRELSEESHKVSTAHRNDPEWKPHFKNIKVAKDAVIAGAGITPEEQKRPSMIPYWKHPEELSEEKTPSRPFLRWLFKWLYADTSAQAHLSANGLFMTAPFILLDLLGENRKLAERDEYHSYRFHQFSRTILIVLAVATEIDSHFKLGCENDASYLWGIIQGYVIEGKNMYDQRYDALLNRNR